MRTKVPSFLRLLYGPLDNMSKFLKVSGITVAVGAALYAGLGYFGVPYVSREPCSSVSAAPNSAAPSR